MRPYKFRAWHKLQRIMLYEDAEHRGKCFQWLAEGQPIEIMQWTGLTDRHRKEIWEGDIVTEGWVKYIIQWAQVKAGWIAFSPKYVGHGLSQEDARINLEVIGDIYQNPELLEE